VLFLVFTFILVEKGLAVLPPEAIEDNKRRATYHFTLAIDDIVVSETPASDTLDTCRIAGHIEKMHRKPLLPPMQPAGALDSGSRFAADIPCWNESKRPEPPGPGRLYHSGPTRPGRIEVWGSFIDDEFVIFEFEGID
jgi:hypothetical protein